MAKVVLRNAWYAPGGRYFFQTEGDTFTEVPDELALHLPPSAIWLDKPEPVASVTPEPEPEPEASVTPDPEPEPAPVQTKVRRRAPAVA